MKLEQCFKIGDKYYPISEVQKIFDTRIESVIPEDLEE